jgi:hypothetical protein
MRWNQGRATVDKLIADGELQRVPPSREHADQLIAQARKDLASAEQLCASNAKRAYESLLRCRTDGLDCGPGEPGTPAY